MAFFAGNDPIFTKLADFHRHGASVNAEIIGKRLPIIGDRERTGFVLFSLYEQVGHQFFSGSSVGGDLDFLVEKEILRCYDTQKVEDDPAVEGTGTGAAYGEAPAVNEHYLAVIRSDNADGKGRYSGTSEGFTEQLRRLDTGNYASVSVIVLTDDLSCAGKDNAHIFCRISLLEDDLIFLIAENSRIQTSQHGRKVV